MRLRASAVVAFGLVAPALWPWICGPARAAVFEVPVTLQRPAMPAGDVSLDSLPDSVIGGLSGGLLPKGALLLPIGQPDLSEIDGFGAVGIGGADPARGPGSALPDADAGPRGMIGPD
jgi:hypothetical protein